MDQDNRQGASYDPSNGAASGQQSFFFNPQQQQFFQNQLMHQQVASASQIHQTPQMLPAQRALFQMQGSQPLFQQAQLAVQGLGQLPGGAQFAGALGHDGHPVSMRQDLLGQGVGAVGSMPSSAQQLSLIGLPHGYGSQDHFQAQQQRQQQQAQQQQQALQQIQQQRQSYAGALSGDPNAFIQQQASAGGLQGQQLSNQGQSQIQSQYQQAIMAMQKQHPQQQQVSAMGAPAQKQDMLHQHLQSTNHSIPQTPQQNAFQHPQHSSHETGNNQQTTQPQRQQAWQQSSSHQNVSGGDGPNVGISSSTYGGASGQNQNQNLGNSGNSLIGTSQPPQTNLSASLQQQLANVQAQQQNSQGQSITSQLLNQFLSSQQNQSLTPAPHQSVFSQMKANGQWPQSLGITTSSIVAPSTAVNQVNNTANSAAPLNQGRQNEHSSSNPQNSQTNQQISQNQQLQNNGQQSVLNSQQLIGDGRSNQSVAQQMWHMQQQNNRQQHQIEDRQQQVQPSSQSQSQTQNNFATPQAQVQGQNVFVKNQFSGQQQNQQHNQTSQQRQLENSVHQQFRESNIKQEQQASLAPHSQFNQIAQHVQQPPQTPKQQFSVHEHSQSLQQPQQHHGQLHGGNQGFFHVMQKPGNETKQGDPQQLLQGYPFQQDSLQPKMPQQTISQPQQQISASFMGQAMNRLVQGSREQTYQGMNDPEAKGPMTSQHAMLSQLNQGLFSQPQKELNINVQQQSSNPINSLQHLQHQQQQNNDPYSQYQAQIALQQKQISAQSSFQHASTGLQQNNSGMQQSLVQPGVQSQLPNQIQAHMQQMHQQQTSQLSQAAQLQNSQHISSMQGSVQQQIGQSLLHQHPNQSLLLQLGMGQSVNQQAQLDQRSQQTNSMGMSVKQEPVNQQHLLAAISSIGQGQTPQGLNPSKPPQQVLQIPGQIGTQMGGMTQNLDGLQMSLFNGGALTQGPDQMSQGQGLQQSRGNDMMVHFMQQNAVGGPPDSNMLQITQQQQQQAQNQEWNISSIPSLSKMAEFCATRGDYQQAIEYYRQLITHDPNNGASWTALGHCYLLTEDIHKAFTAYQHALYSVEDMNDPQLWYGIGILYERFESYDNAISALIGVLKMSPNFYQKSEVLYKLGTIFAKTNQIDQASKFFQNSILTSSFSVKKKVDTLIKIGLLNEEKKDFQQAKRSFEAALSLNDKNVRVYQHLAWCSFRHGNIESALRYITKAEKRSKDNIYSLYIKGRCLICLDNTQEAFECLSQAAQQLPSEAVFWTSLAVLLYNMGKINESFENITQATTLKHELWEVWYNLGILYETCKQPEEALIAYDMVLSIDPKQPDAQKRILAIKQPKYHEEMNDSQNPVQLQMKHPSYCIPNTLTILRNYWKHHDNKQTTLQPMQPPQSQLQLPPSEAAAAQMRIDTGNLMSTQQPSSMQGQNNLQLMGQTDSIQMHMNTINKQFGEQPNNMMNPQNRNAGLDHLDANEIQQQLEQERAAMQMPMNNQQQMAFQPQLPQKSESQHDQQLQLFAQQQQQTEQQQSDLNHQIMQQQHQLHQLQQQSSQQHQAHQESNTAAQQLAEQEYAFQFNKIEENHQNQQRTSQQHMSFQNQQNNQNQYNSSLQQTQSQQNQLENNSEKVQVGLVSNPAGFPSTFSEVAQKDANVQELFTQFQKTYQQTQQMQNIDPSLHEQQDSGFNPPPLKNTTQQLSQQNQQALTIQQKPSAQTEQNPQLYRSHQTESSLAELQKHHMPIQQQQYEYQLQTPSDQFEEQKLSRTNLNSQQNQTGHQLGQVSLPHMPSQHEEQMPTGFQSHFIQQTMATNQANQEHQLQQHNWLSHQQLAEHQALMQSAAAGNISRSGDDAILQQLSGTNGPKDDETEQEQSSEGDDNCNNNKGAPHQHNLQNMQVINGIPFASIQPSEFSGNDAQHISHQKQVPIELNVEGVHEQFRQPLSFQTNQSLSLQNQGSDNLNNNVPSFSTVTHKPPQSQISLQQQAEMVNPGILPNEDNQASLLDFGLGELARPFKTAAKTDLDDAPKKEVLPAMEQQSHDSNQIHHNIQLLNPEQTSQPFLQGSIQHHMDQPQKHQQQVKLQQNHDQNLLFSQQSLGQPQSEGGMQSMISMHPSKSSLALPGQFQGQETLQSFGNSAQQQQQQIQTQQPSSDHLQQSGFNGKAVGQRSPNLQSFPKQQHSMQVPSQLQSNQQYCNQVQQQFPILRKMPFIAQTQLGFAPMLMGDNQQMSQQQLEAAIQMQQHQQQMDNCGYSDQQQQISAQQPQSGRQPQEDGNQQ